MINNEINAKKTKYKAGIEVMPVIFIIISLTRGELAPNKITEHAQPILTTDMRQAGLDILTIIGMYETANIARNIESINIPIIFITIEPLRIK